MHHICDAATLERKMVLLTHINSMTSSRPSYSREGQSCPTFLRAMAEQSGCFIVGERNYLSLVESLINENFRKQNTDIHGMN